MLLILILIAAVASAAVAAALLVRGALAALPAEEPLFGPLARNRAQAREASALFRLVEPVMGLLARANRTLDLPTYRRWLTRNLLHAGQPAGLRPDDVLALHQIAAFAGLTLGAYVSVALSGRPLVGLMVLLGAAAACLPASWLSQTVDARLKSVNRGLPYAVNVILLGMEAGLDFTSAVRRYVALGASRPDVMREELELALGELELGRTRREALEALAARVPSETVRGVVVAAVQADRLGTPLAKTLREQVQVVQSRRTQAAEKQAAESSVKILGPLMFIFAAVFLTLFSSFIIRGCGGGGVW